jgi:hypothetical protein
MLWSCSILCVWFFFLLEFVEGVIVYPGYKKSWLFFIAMNTSEIWEIIKLKYIKDVNVCTYKIQHLTSIKQHETRQHKTQIK